MPELVRLVAQGKPVIRRHDLAVLVDRAEDHEIGPDAQRANFGFLKRPKATRESELRFIGDVLAAKDKDRMLLECRSRHPICGVVRRDLDERYPAQFRSKARTQRDDFHRRPPFDVCSTFPPNQPRGNPAGGRARPKSGGRMRGRLAPVCPTFSGGLALSSAVPGPDIGPPPRTRVSVISLK